MIADVLIVDSGEDAGEDTAQKGGPSEVIAVASRYTKQHRSQR